MQKTEDRGQTSSLRVLVVDDSSVMRSYVSGSLKSALDCTLDEASSGFEALRLLPRNTYSLVIADINMPDINGLELIRFIRQLDHLKEIPIIIISTQSANKDRDRAMSLGASAFLSKPFSPSDISESAETLLQKRNLDS